MYNPITGKKTNFESICGEDVLAEKEDKDNLFKYIFLKLYHNSTKCPEGQVPLQRAQIMDYTRCFFRDGQYKGFHYDSFKDVFVLNTLFKANYFEEKKGLYYVNALNDDKGNLFFEFWSYKDNISYFIGKSSETGESMIFDNKNIFSINRKFSSNYHESIFINYNNNTNIFNLDFSNINFIKFKTKETFSKTINNIINNYKSGDDYSHRNSIIKLKNNNYLFSIFIGGYINLITFNFITENINGFKTINNYNKEASYSNSTECFQTDNLLIQCLVSPKSQPNQFSINIYNQDLVELSNNIKLGNYNNSTFTKIFHLKNEIGVYIFFDSNDGNKPKIFFEKLIGYNLFDLINFNSDISKNNGHQHIILDANKTFNNIDNCLFCSDAIKINNSKFVVFLTTKKSNQLLICLFDLYNNDFSLRLRYYQLDLDFLDIKISVNLRAFVFKQYYGLVFYNSYNEYPGYLFFNYPNITGSDKINITTINIKLFVNSSESYVFSLSDNITIVNNIYGGEEKIKIINYSFSSKTGVQIKASKLNSELSLNQILDIDDKLIFEQTSEGIIPGNYTLEFNLFTGVSNENKNVYETYYYGNAQEVDFDDIEYFSEETYKLIYTIECYGKCKTCSQLGNESFYHCVKCLGNNLQVINNGEKCICQDYNYINEIGEKTCLNNCSNEYYKYIFSENEKYCLRSCEYNGSMLQKDEFNKICYDNCADNINGNKYLYKKTCVESCPENYSPDEKGICYNNECEHYLYFDKNIFEYLCTENDICPKNYPYLNREKKLCVEYCKLEDLEQNQCYYYYNNNSKEINNHDEILNNIKIAMKEGFNFKRLENGGNIIIKDEPIIYTISSTDGQNLKSLSNKMSIVDFNECQQILINKNIIQDNQNLYLLKLDIQEEGANTPRVEYEVYHQRENGGNLALLDISECENTRINVILPIKINKNEIDKYNISSDYYNDICNSFTTEDWTDLSLKDRQKEYLDKNINICEEGCYFSEYYFNLEKAVCSCLVKTKMENISNIQINTKRRSVNFKKVKYKGNFDLMKCAFSIFKRKEYRNNSANYIMMIIFLKSIETLILFILRGYDIIKNNIEGLSEEEIIKDISPIVTERLERRTIKNKPIENKKIVSKKVSLNKNQNLNDEELTSKDGLKRNRKTIKNEKKEKNEIEIKEIDYSDSISNKKNENDINEINIYKKRKITEEEKFSFNDSELNILDYEKALKYDKRTYIQYYLSLIKTRHILFSLFFERNGGNLKTIKRYILLFSFGVNYSICILFYNYNTIHKIYEEKGKFNFGYQFPKIISSSFITILLINLVSKICLYEDNILAIKINNGNLQDRQKKELNIIYWKFVSFFIVTYLLLFFFWVYSISFCIVYKNTQTHLLINTIISFIFTCIISLILFLIPGIFRILSFEKGKNQRKTLYIISKVLQIILS